MTDINQILEAARKAGAQQAEVYQAADEETPVRFETNRLKELNSRNSSGVALRVIANGRIGFASSTRPGDVHDVVAAAMETAPFGPEAHFDFPPKMEPLGVDVYDPATETIAVDDMIQIGQTLIDAITTAQPEILCDAAVRRTAGEVTLANSSGARFSYKATMLSAWVNGTFIRGTDMLFVGDGDASCSPKLDVDAIKASVVGQLHNARHNATSRTGDMPVLFTSIGVAEALIGPLVMAFSGRLVHQGQSPLAGLLGEEKYDRRISLSDDATLAMRPASRPFDDEGVGSRVIPLIDKGTIRSFMYDLQTAGLAKTHSTASAGRSLTTQPSISPSSLVFAEGDTTLEDMIGSVKEGIVVEELMGAGQGNVMGGDFSGNVLLGYKIENGEIVGRVKDTIVAGNVHDALANIRAIGNRARWVGGTVFAPPILFERLAVSAKGS